MLALVYVASALVCYCSIFFAMKRMKVGNHYSSSFSLLPLLAGFGVFPIINTFLAVACAVWVLNDFKPFNLGE
jgi:hypothetical protein